MPLIRVKEDTHKALKELRRFLSYDQKKECSIDDVVRELIISRVDLRIALVSPQSQKLIKKLEEDEDGNPLRSSRRRDT